MMKLLLACVTVALLAPEVELARYNRRRRVNIRQDFESANITVIPQDYACCYVGENELTPGVYIDFEDTSCPPSIEYDDRESGCFYTIIILDYDMPTPDNSYESPYLLYFVVNVDDLYDFVNCGDVLAPYCGPLCSAGCDAKRYVVLIYRQNSRIDSANCIANSYNTNRDNFDPTCYATDNNLGEPIAGTYCMVNCPSANIA